MHPPELHLVTDGTLPSSRLLAVIGAAVDGGVNIVQIRDKAAAPETVAALVRAVHTVIAGRALVIVNGGVELARVAAADGIHLPEGHPDLGRARQALGSTAYVGASVHSVPAARLAEQAGVTSITFGAVFATASHPGAAGQGLAALRAVVAAVRTPVIAIGGIAAGRVPDVLAAGASGVAVISAILRADDPRAAATELRAALDAGGRGDLREPSGC